MNFFRSLTQFFQQIESIKDLNSEDNLHMINILGKATLENETVEKFLYFCKHVQSTLLQPEEILNAKQFNKEFLGHLPIHQDLRDALKQWETDSTISFKGLRADSAKYELLIAQDWNRQENLDVVENSLRNYKANILRLKRMLNDYKVSPQKYDNGKDDIVLNGSRIKLPKGKKIKFQFRSKDVIHSAYFPHFRAQMNTVPGMKTFFTFEPKETNQEFFDKVVEEGKVYMHITRDEEGNILSKEERPGTTGYVLLCNKICGASHYNMKMFIDVVEPEEFEQYLNDLTFFK